MPLPVHQALASIQRYMRLNTENNIYCRKTLETLAKQNQVSIDYSEEMNDELRMALRERLDLVS